MGTKYRYVVLEGAIKIRCGSLLIQICEVEDICIMKEVVSKDHIYMYIEYRLSQDISTIVKLLKGKTSGRISGVKVALFGTSFFGYWFGCWSTSNIMDVMINEYLEHHRSSNNNKNNNFIIED